MSENHAKPQEIRKSYMEVIFLRFEITRKAGTISELRFLQKWWTMRSFEILRSMTNDSVTQFEGSLYVVPLLGNL